MKLRFLPADAQGRFDNVLHDRLWQHMDNWVSSGEDATIVPISWQENFTFNPELYGLNGKNWVLADTLETYGQWPDGKTHLFGISNTPPFGGNSEWQKFSSFVRDNPPILQFVRELYQEDASRFIRPLEWPCPHAPWDLEPKQNFDTRPFEVFYWWGWSSCLRPQLHGKIYQEACDRGYEVISHLDHVDAKIHQPGRKWISSHIPHTHRVDFSQIGLRQAQSKIVVSMPGAARKCFRSTEAPLHSVMAMMDDGLVWAHEWKHERNCIRISEGNEIQNLELAIKADDLHQIYLNSQATLDLYRPINYIHNHILPSIEAVL